MFQILCSILVALSFFTVTQLTLSAKLAFIAGTIGIGTLADIYIVRKVAFFKILTIGIIVVIYTSILGMLAWIFDITFQLTSGAHWLNASFLAAIFITFYLSVRIGANATYFQRKQGAQETRQAEKYLIDTCVIIDGRILDIAQSGFIPRSLTIPQFVIQELQLISDSYNHEKRTKGRRGLDLLKQMKNSDHLSVRIITDDIPEEKTVDRKLLHLAKKGNYKVITTDYNLVKVAQLENITTLNLNHLATLIKSNLSLGDKLRVYITKKGNNKNQGIAFLPDDTMVIVEEAERFIGHQKNVMISSYIQNESGRIAFAKLIN